MKVQNILVVSIILILSFQICLGQDFVEDENWIGNIEGGIPPYLIHRLDKYTKEDVIKAKERLNLIKQAKVQNEWEGAYSLFWELSDTKLFLISETGFVNYYVYTRAIELRSLNYGKIINNPDSIILITEKPQPPFFGTGKAGQIKLIKVKWGEKHFLVEEKDLETFCELAAGYYGAGKIEEIEVDGEKYPTQISIWDFWVKSEDALDKKVFGLPILPKHYEKLIKKPIEAKIISIDNYEKDEPTEEPVATYSRRYVIIDSGTNSGIKIGMDFYVPDLSERIKIVKVSDKTSVGVLKRWLDSDTREEECFKASQVSPCKQVKKGMTVKTVSEELLEDN